MPNSIGPDGLEVKTSAELVEELTTAYQTIYGPDINLEQNSPDGQMMMIFIQAVLDLEDLLVQVYNQFDPDNAVGAVLDQRVAINGIQRQAGTYTTTNITIVTSQALTLTGLDDDPDAPYTVADNAGNQWQLMETEIVPSADTVVALFRSAVPGEVLTVPNTITVPVTVVLGVTSVNNPTSYATLGINEETDAELKIRRQRSVSLSSQGYLAGLLAALENIPGVSSAYVFENTSDTTDGDGIPPHSIWVIVAGSATSEEIAEVIYQKRNAGCGMKGSTTYTITQVDGTPFIVKWDDVVAEDLFIEFDASSLDGINPPNTALILEQLPSLFVPGVYEQVNVNDLATIVQSIDSNTLVTGAGFSTSALGPFTPTLTPTLKNNQFAVDADNIDITVI